jgi:hypothetical protein
VQAQQLQVARYKFALRANLNNIQVNHSLQLAGGSVEAKYGGELIIMGSENDPYAQKTPGKVDFTHYAETRKFDSPIKEIIRNEEGEWVVITEDDQRIVITPNAGGTLVVGPDGKGYVVNDDKFYPVDLNDPAGDEAGGTLAGGSTGSGNPIVPSEMCDAAITFAPGGSLHRFGFDE